MFPFSRNPFLNKPQRDLQHEVEFIAQILISKLMPALGALAGFLVPHRFQLEPFYLWDDR